jgi:hypothetical protein
MKWRYGNFERTELHLHNPVFTFVFLGLPEAFQFNLSALPLALSKGMMILPFLSAGFMQSFMGLWIFRSG